MKNYEIYINKEWVEIIHIKDLDTGIIHSYNNHYGIIGIHNNYEWSTGSVSSESNRILSDSSVKEILEHLTYILENKLLDIDGYSYQELLNSGLEVYEQSEHKDTDKYLKYKKFHNIKPVRVW